MNGIHLFVPKFRVDECLDEMGQIPGKEDFFKKHQKTGDNQSHCVIEEYPANLVVLPCDEPVGSPLAKHREARFHRKVSFLEL